VHLDQLTQAVKEGRRVEVRFLLPDLGRGELEETVISGQLERATYRTDGSGSLELDLINLLEKEK
jgi:hypothetical protein